LFEFQKLEIHVVQLAYRQMRHCPHDEDSGVGVRLYLISRPGA
jgi:hypothetical protein